MTEEKIQSQEQLIEHLREKLMSFKGVFGPDAQQLIDQIRQRVIDGELPPSIITDVVEPYEKHAGSVIRRRVKRYQKLYREMKSRREIHETSSPLWMNAEASHEAAIAQARELVARHMPSSAKERTGKS